MSGKGCQPCGGARWACPGMGDALPCRRTTADGSNPIVTMFPEDIRCSACDAQKPVDQQQVKLEAYVKANPEMAFLLPNGKGKAWRRTRGIVDNNFWISMVSCVEPDRITSRLQHFGVSVSGRKLCHCGVLGHVKLMVQTLTSPPHRPLSLLATRGLNT